MIHERFDEAPLPTAISPRTQISDVRVPPFVQGNAKVMRDEVNEQGWPGEGEILIAKQPPAIYIPLDEDATEAQILGALHAAAQHQTPLQPDEKAKNQNVIIATPNAQKIIEGHEIYRRFPVIPSGLLDNILHLDELHRYGVERPLGTQLGDLYIKALVFDRVVRASTLDETPQWDIKHPKYPKAKSGKQYLRLAETLAANSSAFYAQMVTSKETADAVSIFPPDIIAEQGTADKPIGKIVYHALTRDDLWPTHREMGRREFFESIPLGTGEHVQNLLSVLSAIDYAAASKRPIARVFDAAGLQDPHLEPIGDMAKDYSEALTIIGDVLFAKGKRLIDATATDYAEINHRFTETGNSRLGQVLPPLRTMLSKGMVNLEELAKARRYLFSTNWSGFSQELRALLPSNHRSSEELTTDMLIEAIQRMLEATRSTIQLPGLPTGLPDPIIDEVREILRRRIQTTVALASEQRIPIERYTHLIQSNMASWLTKAISEALRSADMFNVRDASGQKINFSPDSPEMQRFFAQGERYVRTHDDIVALEPFHEEPTTARPIYDYLRTLFPKNRVITGGNHIGTLNSFEGVDGLVVQQDEVLKFISPEVRKALGLDRVIDWTIIQQDKETGELKRGIKNTKGDTLLSLVLTGIATGIIHPETDLMLSDSDFENPQGQDGYYAAHALAGAKANQSPDEETIMTNIGRLGPQRRNHSVQMVVNEQQNLGSPLQRRIATNMNRLMWYLSGERIVKADLIMNHPFPNGYSMEVWLDLMASMEDYFETDLTLAQIAVTTRKMLSDSKPSKDWAMTYYCGLMLNIFFNKWDDEIRSHFISLPTDLQAELKDDPLKYLEWEKTLRGKGVMPNDWSVEVLKGLNEEHAGRPFFITTPDEAAEEYGEHHETHNFGNEDYFIPRDMLRPSITTMNEKGWIDWQGIVDYVRSRGIEIDPIKLENAWWKQQQREHSAPTINE